MAMRRPCRSKARVFFYSPLLATSPFCLLVNEITSNTPLWPPTLAFMRQRAHPGWGGGQGPAPPRLVCALMARKASKGLSLLESKCSPETIRWRLLASSWAGVERLHASSGAQEGSTPASLCRNRAMGMAGSATDRLPLLPLLDMLIANQVSFQRLDLA